MGWNDDNTDGGPAALHSGSAPLSSFSGAAAGAKPAAAGGDTDKGDKTPVAKVQRKRPKVDESSLVKPGRGLQQLVASMPRVFKGRGHEAADAAKMMRGYQAWAASLAPFMAFEDLTSRCDKLKGKAVVSGLLEKLRADEAERWLGATFGARYTGSSSSKRARGGDSDGEAGERTQFDEGNGRAAPGNDDDDDSDDDDAAALAPRALPVPLLPPRAAAAAPLDPAARARMEAKKAEALARKAAREAERQTAASEAAEQAAAEAAANDALEDELLNDDAPGFGGSGGGGAYGQGQAAAAATAVAFRRSSGGVGAAAEAMARAHELATELAEPDEADDDNANEKDHNKAQAADAEDAEEASAEAQAAASAADTEPETEAQMPNTEPETEAQMPNTEPETEAQMPNTEPETEA
jgi:hypothetical protein